MCLSHEVLTAAYQDFLDQLTAAELLIPSGVPGVYGHSGVFERVLEGFDQCVTRRSAHLNAEVIRFPGVLNRQHYLKTSHIESFPDLMGSIHSFTGNERDHVALLQKRADGADWTQDLKPTQLMLTPATCYPLYPTATGTLREGGRIVDLRSFVFRHEPSIDPCRMQMFRMRESVRIGSPEQALAHRGLWMELGQEILNAAGLNVDCVVANDPFFGRGGRVMAVSQKEQSLKFEMVIPVATAEKPTAIMSCNYHLDYFGKAFDIRTADGQVAHSACIGFGLERVTLALFKTHGFNPDRWPADGTDSRPPRKARSNSGTGSMTQRVLTLDPSNYQRHRLHTQERNWAETNCYVDLWIELLHAWGFEPLAAMPFTLAIDFEGDQWTFFKFPLADLWDLYGLDVQELAIWRPVVSHVEEQIERGRPVLVELDSYYLPDTGGTAYQIQHQKTTVATIEIDVQSQRLGYFHGQGYYELHGDDFVNIFNLEGVKHPAVLPPYAEFVKRRSSTPLVGDDLVQASLRLLRRQRPLLPEGNPFSKFKPRFEADLQWLANEPIETFHQYSFATLRQFGSCYEVAATYLNWLQSQGVSQLERPIAAFSGLSANAKTMQFQLARAMARKKPMDLSILDQMATTWEMAIEDLKARFL